MGTIAEELQILLNSEVPAQISKIEENSGQLDRAASYCEMIYSQTKNKAEAFNTTKKLTLQSLASVAYYISSLSEAVLRSLDLEAENLAAKAAEARNIDQVVAIQREKSARREIGKLTVSRNVVRKNKITYPAVEEKTPRYQRTPIDYSLLDGIGHGRQTVPQQSDYGGATLNRSGSMASNDYGIYSGGVYADYAGRGATLTRNSIRSIVDHQYRTPQLIPSAIALENQQQHQIYQQLPNVHSIPPQQQQMYMRMNSQDNVNNGGQIINGHDSMPPSVNNNYNWQLTHEMSELGFTDTPTSDHMTRGMSGDPAGLNPVRNGSVGSGNYTLNRIRQPPPQMLLRTSNNNNDRVYGGGNGDPPSSPPLLHADHPDEPLPPPPLVIDNIQLGAPNLDATPPDYIEKARVIYAYEANRPDELTLVENAVVYVLKKNEDGWFEGVLNGITGMFPGNYVIQI